MSLSSVRGSLARFAAIGVLGVALLAPGQAVARNYVLEDWDGPAPAGSWLSNPQLDVNGWQPAVSDIASFATSLGPTSWSPRGLYATSYLSLFAQPGTAEWRFKAPGTSTVYRADYAPVLTRTVGCVNLGMRSAAGGWQDTINGHPGGFARRSAHPSACTPGAIVPFTPVGQVYIGFSFGRQVYCSNTSTFCDRTGSPTGNSAVFGVQRTRLLQPRFDAYLPGARLYLTDYDKPTFQAGANTLTDWVRTGTGTVTAKTTDTGLGVKRVTVAAPTLGGTTAQSNATEHPCTGDRNDRCPASWNAARPSLSAPLTYNVDQLPEGVNPFTATATDIVDNASATDTTSIPPAKVDRSAPTDVTVAGPLVEDEDHYFNGNDPVAITVTATDPASADGQQLSGIKAIRIEKVGGPTLATTTLNCTGTLGRCPKTINETLNANLTALPEGAHQLQAVVTDQTGNTTTSDTWDVYIDRTPPEFDDGDLGLGALDQGAGVSSVVWHEAYDSPIGDGIGGSGVEYYLVKVDGVFDWRRSEEWQIDVERPLDVLGVVSVRPVDRVGNVGTILSALPDLQAGDGDDGAPLPDDLNLPSLDDQVLDADGQLTPDEQREVELATSPDSEPTIEFAAGGTSSRLAAGPARCVGRWAPIQAKFSGFVIGGCASGTAVNAVAVKTAPHQPGSSNEGKSWAAVALPAGAGFDGCGWVNVRKLQAASSSPAAGGCGSLPGADYDEFSYIKRYKTRLSGSPRPNTQKYKGLYVWKRKIVRYENRNGVRTKVVYEGDGRKYVPDFNNPNASCTAYANINPYKGGQQVIFGERMWTVHNHSPNFRIRYIAKFRANNENGSPRWWVMARSLSQNDDDQPWGWVSAECLFTF